MNQIEDKRVFLICTDNQVRSEAYAESIKKHINNSVVFLATDGNDALFKMDNYPPDVLVIDMFLAKKQGFEVVEHVLQKEKLKDTKVIITSLVPDKEHFVNEVVTGQVQFLVEIHDEDKFHRCVVKSLNRIATGGPNQYHLKFLVADEILFNEGDLAQSVFIVRKGEMAAIKGTVELGIIKAGEFVGEMAHINNEPRSATVKAINDCELIEIPRGSLDVVLFTKPSWARALVSNLSKRLKQSNEALAK